MEKIHRILSLQKNGLKSISGKVFFNCVPFMTVTNNTNSDVTKDCLSALTQSQRSRLLKKIYEILSLHKKNHKKYNCESIFLVRAEGL